MLKCLVVHARVHDINEDSKIMSAHHIQDVLIDDILHLLF